MSERVSPEMCAVVFKVVEDGGGHGQGLMLERDQVGAALCAQPSHGRVGSAKIDAERTGGGIGHGGEEVDGQSAVA